MLKTKALKPMEPPPRARKEEPDAEPPLPTEVRRSGIREAQTILKHWGVTVLFATHGVTLSVLGCSHRGSDLGRL